MFLKKKTINILSTYTNPNNANITAMIGMTIKNTIVPLRPIRSLQLFHAITISLLVILKTSHIGKTKVKYYQ